MSDTIMHYSRLFRTFEMVDITLPVVEHTLNILWRIILGYARLNKWNSR